MEREVIIKASEKVGQEVKISGWVDSVRDHGKVTFIDLRDRSGIIQCVGQNLPKVSSESVVEIVGEVCRRPEKLINKDIPTGDVEVQIKELRVITKASEIPIPVGGEGLDIDESHRLKYRYLDLRRSRMARNMRMRHKAINFIRKYLTDEEFVEIETPVITKTTPEGARDFIVPSRLQPGGFYALPQSPQQYKQLLMVAGFERYFQIARCFRDEDPRADRAYGEFTQLDLEMSFVTQEDILQLAEDLFTKMIGEIFPEVKLQQTPWPRMTHKEAMEKYGSDKPDIRKNKSDPNEMAFLWVTDFPLFVEQTEEDYFHGAGSAKWAPSHHMFTAPHPDDVELLDSDPGKVRGLQHDMVLNGYEVGGGSVRIHDPKVQRKVFDLIGFSREQKQEFSHMLEAFAYGVPPHGGIAPGIDRLLMVLLGEPSLREVIAFPMSSSGQTSVMDAPSDATSQQLSELGIKVVDESKESGTK